jgi:hypothetical protein
MYIEDFSVSRRSGCRGWFLGHQGLIFCQRFLSQQESMCAEDVSVSPRTGLLGWFLGPKVLVFVNGFWASNRLCTLKISASAVEVGVEDDFWDTRDSMCAEDVSLSPRTRLLGWFLGPRYLVFINGFWASSSLCTLKISASAVKLGFKDDFWDTKDSIFVNGFSVNNSLCAQKMSASAVKLGFLYDFWVLGTKYSLTVAERAVVYVH